MEDENGREERESGSGNSDANDTCGEEACFIYSTVSSSDALYDDMKSNYTEIPNTRQTLRDGIPKTNTNEPSLVFFPHGFVSKLELAFRSLMSLCAMP